MSAGAMRFPSRGRWLLWLIVLLVLGPFLVIFPAALWLGWTMNPVQNFYLGTYAACSTLSGYPDAVTTVRYAEKTAPGRKPEPLLPDDAAKGSDPKQPLALSSKALSEGWRGVTILLGFRNAYVFDISQTDGVDLPAMHEVSGDPGENIDRLAAFLKSKGIQLVYNEKIAPALGMSYGGRIAILPGQSKAETFATLVHETAHELLHKSERRTATTKTVRETEAEAVAFVVGKAVGLVTGSASADYIQLYHGNASLLAESLEVIQQTASVILAALEPPISEKETATTEAAELVEVAA